MNTLEFMKANKTQVSLLTHCLTESEWFKNEADSSQRSQASVIKADLIKASKSNAQKAELLALMQKAVMVNKDKQIIKASGFESSLGDLFATIF